MATLTAFNVDHSPIYTLLLVLDIIRIKIYSISIWQIINGISKITVFQIRKDERESQVIICFVFVP